MKPRISFLTLGVDDLERALSFYRDGLGWPTQGIVGAEFEYGAVVFFDLAGGLKLALWPRTSLARDIHRPVTPPSLTDMAIAHNVDCKADVAKILAQAEKAGATLIKPPHETFYGGYAGYFADPDGHLWEIAWNPAFNLPA